MPTMHSNNKTDSGRHQFSTHVSKYGTFPVARRINLQLSLCLLKLLLLLLPRTGYSNAIG